MSHSFVPFRKVRARQVFYIHDTRWIKCPHTRQSADIVFNAYSLERTQINHKDRGLVDVRYFEDVTLVQVDPEFPLASEYVRFISCHDNDNQKT